MTDVTPQSSTTATDEFEAPLFRPKLSPLWWRLTQRGMALFACLCVAPLFFVVYILVKTTSPGPFLFRQRRRGLGGKVFSILKIRTLRVDAEKQTALGVDRRSSTITPVGWFLRQLKIDELPQLWNIVRGEMEFVGPRPIPIALEDTLRDNILSFHERNAVRPGLTAFSQIIVVDNGTGDQLLDDWTERFQAELHYIRNKSVLYDIVVIAFSALYLTRSFIRVAKSRSSKTAPKKRTVNATTSTRILTTPISDLDYEGVIERVADFIDRGAPRYVGVAPVHSVVESLWNRRHRAVMQAAAINTADGQPVAWAQRLLGFKDASRVYGPTLTMMLCERAAKEGWKVAFYGGHPERLEQLVQILREKFQGIDIVEAYSPPFRKLSAEEDEEICDRFREKNPDLVFVGLGCPKQERWMNEHSGRIPGVMLGVGAAFDFHAGALRQSPKILQKIGMEWAFRLYCEPKRLFKRYATTNPAFVFHFGLQFVQKTLFGKSMRQPMLEPAGFRSEAVEADPTSARLAICMGTMRRPELLADTLEGLRRLELPENVRDSVELRIVDNDVEGSAEAVVEAFRSRLPQFTIRYEIEPDRNIARVRNRAVDMGFADYVAFLDDDERPDLLWVARLLETAEQSKADGVFGSVFSRMPDGAPAWAERSGFFDKIPHPVGAEIPIQHARTSNALIRGKWFYETGLRFEPEFGRSGAEDLELFLAMRHLGAAYRAAPDAIVREAIQSEQASSKWLSRRAFRYGVNRQRIARRHGGLRNPALRCGMPLLTIVPRVPFALLGAVCGMRTPWTRVRIDFATAVGGLSELLAPGKFLPKGPYGNFLPGQKAEENDSPSTPQQTSGVSVCESVETGGKR
ncbi:MAG: WecB/TagA/CpsF family glycosyltransferase [Planctomycetota bacterium]